MATYYTLLTKIGQASIANAVALNKPVNLTSMAVGDGNGNPTTPNENQTALVREKYRAQINQLTVDPDNPNYLIAELIIPTTVGGWSIYEVGVFDDQSQLIAVANFPATYKPELAEGSGRDLIVRIVIQVSNTSVVTLKVDPAVILASQAWVAANYVKKVTVAGGTTGQVLAKNSNANEDFKWIDPTAAVNVVVDSQTEEQTLATNQTVIDLAKLTTTAVAIYVEGVRLYPGTHYTINTNTRLTLKTSYPNGSKILAVQNDPTSTIKLASTTERGFTILSNEFSTNDESKAATPNAIRLALASVAENLIPVGIPMPWPGATPPDGWIKCNGSPFSASDYPKLAQVFPSLRTPDLRGEFVRGWDDGRGIDSGRALLSTQQGSLMALSVSANTDDDRISIMHIYSPPSYEALISGVGMDSMNGYQKVFGVNKLSSTLTAPDTTSPLGTTVTGNPAVGGVARPRNIAFNYIVRAA